MEDLTKWLTKPEAMATMKCSESTLERLVKKGQIGKQSRPVPGRKSEPVYNPGDVLREAGQGSGEIKSSTDLIKPAGSNGLSKSSDHVTSNRQVLNGGLVKSSEAKSSDGLTILAAMIGRFALASKMNLTRREIRDVYGYTESFLKRAVGQGSLPVPFWSGREMLYRRCDLDLLDPRTVEMPAPRPPKANRQNMVKSSTA